MNLIRCNSDDDRIGELVSYMTKFHYQFIKPLALQVDTYRAMKHALIERFGDTRLEHEKIQEIGEVKQKSAESVDEYFE